MFTGSARVGFLPSLDLREQLMHALRMLGAKDVAVDYDFQKRCINFRARGAFGRTSDAILSVTDEMIEELGPARAADLIVEKFAELADDRHRASWRVVTTNTTNPPEPEPIAEPEPVAVGRRAPFARGDEV
jgi:hypothetical protein